MATRRKKFTPKAKRPDNARHYAEFIAALLDGSVQANKLVEKRNGKRFDLEYDDPNG